MIPARNGSIGLPDKNIKLLHGHLLLSYHVYAAKKNNVDLPNVAYMGNDINDKEAMDIVGKTFCPADSHDSIKAISDHALKTKGGHGVIRELFDFLITKESQNE